MIRDHASALAKDIGAAKVIGLAAVAVVVALIALGGWLQWAQDAPIIVGENTAHITGHHDSIAALFVVTAEQVAAYQAVETHLGRDSLANAERDRKLDYLVCLRLERQRVLDSLPQLQDCDRALLEGR